MKEKSAPLEDNVNKWQEDFFSPIQVMHLLHILVENKRGNGDGSIQSSGRDVNDLM
jgi:hypothetical protein